MNTIELLKQLKGNMTQEEFGKLLGVHQTTVSNYLTGKRTPGRRVCFALLRAFPNMRDTIINIFFAPK